MKQASLKDRLTMGPRSEIGGRRGCLVMFFALALTGLLAMILAWLVVYL